MITQIAQLLLSLTILVALHEMGHFLAAKMFKTRVEKFYIFFNPWFSVFKKKIGETTYGIGWLPLGGYVKISGMIDESMDKEQLKKEPEPWEFRSKPRWQKLIIMLGGIFVNVVLAFFIYSMVLLVWGKENIVYNSQTNTNGGIEVMYFGCMDRGAVNFNEHANMPIDCDELDLKVPPAFSLLTGDQIIEIDGQNVEDNTFRDVFTSLILWGEKDVTVKRSINGDTKTETIKITDSDVQLIIAEVVMVRPISPVVVDSVIVGETDVNLAHEAGLLPGVKITNVNNEKIRCYSDLKTAFNNNRGMGVNIGFEFENDDIDGDGIVNSDDDDIDGDGIYDDGIYDDGKIMPINVALPDNYDPKIGFTHKAWVDLFEADSIEYSLFGGKNPSCIPAGISETKKEISNYLGQLALMFAPETGAYKEVGGFIKIGSIFPEDFSWRKFWVLTAMLSIMLAVINLLPIPALDGGHAAILTFEMIIGRDLSPKILERLQIVGMIVLFALFIYANGLDILNLFK